MNTNLYSIITSTNLFKKAKHAFAAAGLAIFACNPTYAAVSQTPLYLGGGDVPGNLLLVPSVEWPTINSTASIGDYDVARTYIGYFDANKCYEYFYSPTEAKRHFYPVSWTATNTCSGLWSGNFMNWAATQTVDPFRKVLTGGLRVEDTVTETWLEKARHSGQGGATIFPDRRLPASGNSSTMMRNATPFNENWMRMQIDGRGNKMRFRIKDDDTSEDLEDYDPANFDKDNAQELSVRVQVCVPGFLEPNCRLYPSGNYKPEGLIQQYSDEMRYGVFGYLLDSDTFRDGGVLRARQGFVGQDEIVPNVGTVTNPNAEWDPNTGVLLQNPRPADAAATAAAIGSPIQDSGFINYLNKFGQMTTGNHKGFDPNSELYYAALRYLKNQGNVPEYSAMPGNTGIAPATGADGFPVITNWDDPIQYACQKNVMLGIGDVYTWNDKNLPGSSNFFNEPPTPAAVTADTTVDIEAEIQRVADLEGITIPTNPSFTGRENSAAIAGLAWHANTSDIRPDLPGTQTASTHWVDVLEGESLEPTTVNQYYLTAKYGGFRVPENFDPATAPPLDLDWWHTNGQILTSFGGRADYIEDFPRPDNYYLAGGADEMIQSLTEAFARIAAELRSSATSVAANSTRLGADTAVFQAAFDSTNWSGDLQAFRIFADGTIDPNASWSAAVKLDALTELNITNRKIFTIAPPTSGGGGSFRSTTGADFDWSGLTSSQQDYLRTDPLGGPLLPTAIGQERLDFLRGSRLLEQTAGGPYRDRDSRLGDIVNSDPQFIHKQDFGFALLDQTTAFSSTGAGAAYIAFRQSAAYQNRIPMVVLSANDGMMHGVDASLGSTGGDELFAFVPDAAIENMYELSVPDYSHRFYTDGSPRVSEIWTGSAWKTIAVGTTGAGGKSVFALDVTDPGSMDSSDVMWEFTHPDMGFTIGQAAIVPLPNGQFGVVVTSGYDTGNPDGKIWILNPNDGSIIKTISVTNSGDLGQPLVVDLNNDRVADRIYAGDTEGNLWRYDLVGNDPNNWQPPVALRSGSDPVPLFIARDASGTRRPITAPLASAFGENGLHTVFFGTGTFYQVNDNVVPFSPDVDGFYSVIDRGVHVTGRAELLEQSILAEVTAHGRRVRGVTDYPLESYHSGWFIDLMWKPTYGGPGAVGERIVSKAIVRGDRVIFATLIPSTDPCAFGGDSWLMEVNSFSGGRLDYAVFDLDGDGQFDDDDWIDVTMPDGTVVRMPPSAIAPDVNIIKTPAVITGIGPNDDEVKIVSGSGGQLIRIMERGSTALGRLSWRQLR